MCTHPKHILNPTKTLRQMDKFYLTVKCNECSECRNARRKSFELRLLSDMRAKSKLGYTFCFGTLTYNDISLPHIDVDRITVDNNDDSCVLSVGDKTYVLPPVLEKSEHIKCFNKAHIIALFKYLRKHYTNDGANDNTPVFLCASEFGSHTQRPHYHFIIGCKDTAENIHSLIQNWWSVKNNYGFLFPRRFEGNEMNRGKLTKPFEIKPATFSQSAKYVAKYCCKDLSYYHLPSVKNFEKFLKNNPSDENLHIARYHLPFLHTSRKLGYSLLDYVKDVDSLVNGIKLEGYKNLVALPDTLFRRVIYKRRTVKDYPDIKVLEDGKIKYKYRVDLTELGKEYLLKSLESRCRSLQSDLRVFLEDITTNSLNAFKEFYSDLGYSPASYNKFIFRSKTIVSLLPKIAMFDTYYRNRLSLFHLELLRYDSALFRQSSDKNHCSYVSINGRISPYEFVPEFEVYDGVKIVERFTIDGDDVGYLEYGKRKRPLRFRSSKVMPLFDSVDDIGLYHSSFSLDSLFFTGSETYEFMESNKENFIKEYFGYNRYLDENKVDMEYCKEYFSQLTFNSFPCFNGYDEFLNVYYSWSNCVRSITSQIKESRYNDITYLKQCQSE